MQIARYGLRVSSKEKKKDNFSVYSYYFSDNSFNVQYNLVS